MAGKNGNNGDYGRQWIIENSVEILDDESDQMTVRQLYYRLVADYGMPNCIQSYKRVVSAMTSARWDRTVKFDAFIDRDRTVFGETDAEPTDLDQKVRTATNQVQAWMSNYSKHRWENQPNFVEIWIEKKALQGVFEDVAIRRDVALCPCKGYPSLTFLKEARDRFLEAQDRDQDVKIIYFGDHDPSGDDIPRSLEENLERMGVEVEVIRVALTKEQVMAWNLPPAPTKATDSRTKNWDGIGQVELDAVKPKQLRAMAQEAVDELFDRDLYEDLMAQEREERAQYRERVLANVTRALADEDEDEDDEEEEDEDDEDDDEE